LVELILKKNLDRAIQCCRQLEGVGEARQPNAFFPVCDMGSPAISDQLRNVPQSQPSAMSVTANLIWQYDMGHEVSELVAKISLSELGIRSIAAAGN